MVVRRNPKNKNTIIKDVSYILISNERKLDKKIIDDYETFRYPNILFYDEVKRDRVFHFNTENSPYK